VRSMPGQKLSLPLCPWCKNSVYVCKCDLQMFSGQCFGYLFGLMQMAYIIYLFFVFPSYFTIYQIKLHTIKLGNNIIMLMI